MKFVIAVIIFSVVILIHELGHFLLAKKNHIEVLEFSLGMGPRIISTVKGGTRYSVKLFPLGGSCAMAGEDAEDDSREPLIRLLCGAGSQWLLQVRYLIFCWHLFCL